MPDLNLPDNGIHRKYAKINHVQKMITFIYIPIIIFSLFIVGIITALEIHSPSEKIKAFFTTITVFGLPLSIFLFFHIKNSLRSKKIEKTLQSLSEKLNGKFYERISTINMDWLEWFKRHWENNPPREILEFEKNNSLRKYVFEFTYAGTAFLFMTTHFLNSKRIEFYLFSSLHLEKKISFFNSPSFYEILKFGFVPRIKDTFIHFYYSGNNLDQITFEKMQALLKQCIEFMKNSDQTNVKISKQAIKATKDNMFAALRKTFGFSLNDISLNRLGKLSPSQKNTIIVKSIFAFVMAVIIFSWGAYLVYRERNGGFHIISSGIIVGIILYLSMSVGIFITYCLKPLKIFFNEKVENKIGAAEVSLSHQIRGRGQLIYFYWIHIDGSKFELPEMTQKMIIPGLTYKVYFLASAKKVLSLEVV